MPRARGSKDYVSLAQGLITEASPLSFPEGATSDELNFLLDTNSIARIRRKGFDVVGSDFSIAGDGAGYGFRNIKEVFHWESPNLLILVYSEGRVGATDMRSIVRVHDADAPYTYKGEYEITSTRTTATDYFISGSTDSLIITSTDNNKPTLAQYYPETNQIQFAAIDIYIRDFELLEDGLSISERPVTIDDEHEYNLLNAGWYAERRLSSTSAKGNALTEFKIDLGVYPSNADVAVLGVKADSGGNEEFSGTTLDEVVLGNTEAPRGHYVYNINDFDRQTRLLNKNEDGAPSTTITQDGVINL